MPSTPPASFAMSADIKNLAVREWTCPDCHATHDQDGNGEKNLLTLG